jgi:hypothetical protein
MVIVDSWYERLNATIGGPSLSSINVLNKEVDKFLKLTPGSDRWKIRIGVLNEVLPIMVAALESGGRVGYRGDMINIIFGEEK